MRTICCHRWFRDHSLHTMSGTDIELSIEEVYPWSSGHSSDSKKKRKRKHKRRKKKKGKHQKKSKRRCGIKDILPKQPLYLWAFIAAIFGTILSIISFIMPWLIASTACIVAGQNAAKYEAKVHAYDVFEYRVISIAQIGISILFVLLIHRRAASESFKVAQIIALFIVYAAAVYFLSKSAASHEKKITDYAKAEYDAFAGETCEESKFILDGTFTIWKGALHSSIMLILSAGILTISRSIFISHECKFC